MRQRCHLTYPGETHRHHQIWLSSAASAPGTWTLWRRVLTHRSPSLGPMQPEDINSVVKTWQAMDIHHRIIQHSPWCRVCHLCTKAFRRIQICQDQAITNWIYLTRSRSWQTKWLLVTSRIHLAPKSLDSTRKKVEHPRWPTSKSESRSWSRT